MTSLVNATGLTGAGSIAFGSSSTVSFIAVIVTARGLDVRTPQGATDSQHIIRAGYVALGFQGGGTDPEFWLPPMWINFTGSWFSGARGDGWADTWERVRYSLSPGTEISLRVES